VHQLERPAKSENSILPDRPSAGCKRKRGGNAVANVFFIVSGNNSHIIV
jgi:hypothetical protein